MTARLFESERREWHGGRCIVALPRDRCPVDQLPLAISTVSQPALFRHAGYGATYTTTFRTCRCGWRLVAQGQETKPAATPQENP